MLSTRSLAGPVAEVRSGAVESSRAGTQHDRLDPFEWSDSGSILHKSVQFKPRVGYNLHSCYSYVLPRQKPDTSPRSGFPRRTFPDIYCTSATDPDRV
jgi:hypothetical protein